GASGLLKRLVADRRKITALDLVAHDAFESSDPGVSDFDPAFVALILEKRSLTLGIDFLVVIVRVAKFVVDRREKGRGLFEASAQIKATLVQFDLYALLKAGDAIEGVVGTDAGTDVSTG